MSRRPALILSCEHASSHIPAAYAALFRSQRARRALASHRGFDPGALWVARVLSRELGAPLFCVRVSRLLIEVNRSLSHSALFSEFTSGLGAREAQRLVARYYAPHRERVQQAVSAELAIHHRVLHVAVHSFTPVLAGVTREADVGLLYDPRRPRELALARAWGARFGAAFRVRRNYPYRGVSDGLTTALRKHFGHRYLGFELELNQACLVAPEGRHRLARAVRDSLTACLGNDRA